MDRKLIARFWSRVDRLGEADCWLWLKADGSVSHHAHHKLYFGDGPTRGWLYVHRMSYELHHGPIDSDCVRHSCDARNCVNPSHLFVGTFSDNVREAVIRSGAGKNKLSRADFEEIRRASATGLSSREIAKIFPVTEGHISKIIAGKIGAVHGSAVREHQAITSSGIARSACMPTSQVNVTDLRYARQLSWR